MRAHAALERSNECRQKPRIWYAGDHASHLTGRRQRENQTPSGGSIEKCGAIGIGNGTTTKVFTTMPEGRTQAFQTVRHIAVRVTFRKNFEPRNRHAHTYIGISLDCSSELCPKLWIGSLRCSSAQDSMSWSCFLKSQRQCHSPLRAGMPIEFSQTHQVPLAAFMAQKPSTSSSPS